MVSHDCPRDHTPYQPQGGPSKEGLGGGTRGCSEGGTDVGDNLLEDDLLLAELLVALLAYAASEAGIGLLELGPELLDLAPS